MGVVGDPLAGGAFIGQRAQAVIGQGNAKEVRRRVLCCSLSRMRPFGTPFRAAMSRAFSPYTADIAEVMENSEVARCGETMTAGRRVQAGILGSDFAPK